MPRTISDDCICCGSCASTCPVEAISMGDEHYMVDANTCIDCGACQDNCPMEAISEA